MAEKDNLKYTEKYRRQRQKIRALLENIDEKKNAFFLAIEEPEKC